MQNLKKVFEFMIKIKFNVLSTKYQKLLGKRTEDDEGMCQKVRIHPKNT